MVADAGLGEDTVIPHTRGSASALKRKRIDAIERTQDVADHVSRGGGVNPLDVKMCRSLSGGDKNDGTLR